VALPPTLRLVAVACRSVPPGLDDVAGRTTDSGRGHLRQAVPSALESAYAVPPALGADDR
jgi:hypothetical protein